MLQMKWLHISDIHYTLSGFDSKKIKEKLLKKLQSLSLTLDFILITGDCLYQYGGTQQEIKELADFIKSIARTCHCPLRRIYICPGNHDVSRTDLERNKLIGSIRDDKEKDFSENFNNLCNIGFEKFQMLIKKVTTYDYESYKIFAPKDQNYRIISINTCLLSKDNEDFQKLKVCSEKLEDLGKKIRNDAKLNILIMHHGIEWLDSSDAYKIEHWIEDHYIDVVYCGHTHRAAVETYDDIFRDIKQFTAGAIVLDGYAIPSFYLCELNETSSEINTHMYTYADRSEDWVLDNHHLRKFKDGVYHYPLSRKSLLKSKNSTNNIVAVINDFNARYQKKFGSDQIYANRYEGSATFDTWKIISSLLNIGVSYSRAISLTEEAIDIITSSDFQSAESILSCSELRDVIYDTIVNYTPSESETEFEISCWASRYARRYNRDIEIMVIKEDGGKERLNYNFIKNTLLPKVINKVTGDSIFYEKIARVEMVGMAEHILDFLKNVGMFEIRSDPLEELIAEYITQKPHPWVVSNNKDDLLQYHKDHGQRHIEVLQSGKTPKSAIAQVEAAYHICAAFLVQYDKFIGFSESSPINILEKAINRVNNRGKSLPMQKYQIVQLKKDLVRHGISYERFKQCIGTLYENIIESRQITKDNTRDVLIELWGMLSKLGQDIPAFCANENNNAVEYPKYIFSCGKGFVVKTNLRELTNCFWVEPNWERHEIAQQHLGQQFLVCTLECLDDLNAIYEYLYQRSNKKRLTEVAFVKSDRSEFTQEERKCIRKQFEGKYLRCIFVQPEHFRQFSSGENWRTIFYKIVEISKIS